MVNVQITSSFLGGGNFIESVHSLDVKKRVGELMKDAQVESFTVVLDPKDPPK